MKRFFTACAMSALIALGSLPTEVLASDAFPADSTMAKIAANKKIRIGVKYDQPLFGLRNLKGQVEGFDVEMGKIIAAKLGLEPSEIEWVETVSANREAFLEQKKVDLVIATYAITEKRKQVVSFAGPYLVTGQDILVKKGNPAGIQSADDLKDKRVCVVNGSEGRTTMVKMFPDLPLVSFDSFTKCAEAIKTGSVDGAVIGQPVILGYVVKEPELLEMVGKRIGVERSGIGLPKGDVEFCKFIEATLDEAAGDGRYKAAYDATVGKYMKEDWKKPEFDTCA